MDEHTTDKSTSADSQQVTQKQFPKLSRKRIAVLVSAVVVLAIASFFIFKPNSAKQTNSTHTNTQQPSQNQDQSKQSLFMQQNGQGCKDRDVSFTSAPMKLEELSYIRPLGAMSDGHVTPTDHVYVGGPNPNAAPNSYPVLMPADGTVTTIAAMPAQYIGDRAGQHVATEDHRLIISHSCRYFSIFIHINKLSDKLTSVIGKLQPNENKQVAIELKAGEVVGYIGASTFDWTPVDTRSTLKGFITPSRYDGEPWKIHTVSPFDLYTGELKTQLEAKSLRTVAPVGGKIDYDQPGKLIGNWFREGTGGYSGPGSNNGGRYWDGHLSIVPDYIDPNSTIVSTGNWSGSAKQMLVKGIHDPAKIGEQDGTVKYELLGLTYENPNNPGADIRMPSKGLMPSQNGTPVGVILLQVMPGEKLKVETFPGKSAAQVSGFTANTQIYER